MRLTFELNFVDNTTFQTSYIRNNPRKGIKHLRCFPACMPQGHRSSRFCGRPLDAEVRVLLHEHADLASNEIWTDDLEFIGEFVLATAERPDRELVVSQSWFDSQTHGPQNPSGDIYRGAVISTLHGPRPLVPANTGADQPLMVAKIFVVRFNDNADGSWQCGVRSSARSRHCFRVSVLRRVPEIVATDEPAMSFEEVAALVSPPFRIISARRLNSQLMQLDGPRARTFETKSESSSKREESSDDGEHGGDGIMAL